MSEDANTARRVPIDQVQVRDSLDLGSRYVLGKKLGRGASGTVFQARDTMLDIDVCIKVLHEGLANAHDVLERFKRELLLARRITHPGMCKVYDLQCTLEGDIYFLVMELVEGETLTDILVRDGSLPIDDAVNLVYQACDAIGAAHNEGVVHRDVKPENIMVQPDGRVVILDFGIATAAGLDRLTRPGFVLGSRKYMAPELWTGVVATPLSDVWSLGVILYGCCTGRLPYRAEGTFGVLDAVESAPPPMPSALNHEISPELEAAIMHAMRVKPEERFPSAWAFRDALAPLLKTTPQPQAAMVSGPAGAAANPPEDKDETDLVFPSPPTTNEPTRVDTPQLEPPRDVLNEPTLDEAAFTRIPSTGAPPTVNLRQYNPDAAAEAFFSSEDEHTAEGEFLDEPTVDGSGAVSGEAQPPSFEGDATLVLDHATRVMAQQETLIAASEESEAPFNPFEGHTDDEFTAMITGGSRSLLFEEATDAPPNPLETTEDIKEGAKSETELVPREHRGETRNHELDVRPVYARKPGLVAAVAAVILVPVVLLIAFSGGDPPENPEASGNADDPAAHADGTDPVAATGDRAEPADPAGHKKPGRAAKAPDKGSPKKGTTSKKAPTEKKPADKKASDSRSDKKANDKGTANSRPQPTTRADKTPNKTPDKTNVSPRARATDDKAQYRKAKKSFERAMSRAGLLRGDVPAFDRARSQAAKLSKQKKNKDASRVLSDATKDVSAFKPDRAFVNAKLQRFNRSYATVKDAKTKDTVTKLALEIAKAMNAGDFSTANKKLNAGLRAMR